MYAQTAVNSEPKNASNRRNSNSFDNLTCSEIKFEIARRIYGLLKQRKPITNSLLAKIIEEKKIASWDTVYEAVEIASIMLAIALFRNHRFNVIGSESNREKQQAILDALIKIEELIPIRCVRSLEQNQKQQFSTPLPYAYIAHLLARVDKNDIVLEPSAGNGALGLFAAMDAREVYFNEIDKNRANNLISIFDNKVYRVNGEQIDDLIPQEVRPDVILLNPPFSRFVSYKSKQPLAIAKHLYSSLKRLKTNGRLVLISNESFSPHSKVYRQWFNKIEQIASLKFTVVVDGSIYKGKGTRINTRLTLFEKKLEYTVPSQPTKAKTIQQLYEKVSSYLKQKNSATEIIKQGSLFDLDNSFVVSDNLAEKNKISLSKPNQNIIATELSTKHPNCSNKPIANKKKVNWQDTIDIQYKYIR